MYANKFRSAAFKAVFCEAVDKLVERKMPVPWRNKAIQDITDAYIRQTGEVPDNTQLTRLANYILQDDLSDKLSDKVSRTEYPFLSRGQIRLRYRRELACGVMNQFTRGKRPSRKKHYHAKGAE